MTHSDKTTETRGTTTGLMTTRRKTTDQRPHGKHRPQHANDADHKPKHTTSKFVLMDNKNMSTTLWITPTATWGVDTLPVCQFFRFAWCFHSFRLQCGNTTGFSLRSEDYQLSRRRSGSKNHAPSGLVDGRIKQLWWVSATRDTHILELLQPFLCKSLFLCCSGLYWSILRCISCLRLDLHLCGWSQYWSLLTCVLIIWCIRVVHVPIAPATISAKSAAAAFLRASLKGFMTALSRGCAALVKSPSKKQRDTSCQLLSMFWRNALLMCFGAQSMRQAQRCRSVPGGFMCVSINSSKE